MNANASHSRHPASYTAADADGSFRHGAADNRILVARNLLARAKNIPRLAKRYADVEHVDSINDLSRLPTMTRREFSLTLRDTAKTAGTQAAYIFASGGTTNKPKLSYMPADLFVNEIRSQWAPLDRGDLFLNAYNAGKLWSSHHFHNQIATASGSRVLPVGCIPESDMDSWIDFCAVRKVTALGATPSTLRSFFVRASDLGYRLPRLQSLLWVGEPWDDEIDGAVQDVSPQATRWGLYGSTETWVIGVNSPECCADIFHVLPYQYVQIDAAGLIDVTCLHAVGLNLLLRYQPGDAAEIARCRCARELPAIQINGRRDGVTKFRGTLLDADGIVREARRWPGVRQAQLVLRADANHERMEVSVITEPASGPELAKELRSHFLATNIDIDSVFSGDPEGFVVRVVRDLIKSERTAKTPQVIDVRPARLYGFFICAGEEQR